MSPRARATGSAACATPASSRGGLLALLVAGLALFAPWLAPHDPLEQDLSRHAAAADVGGGRRARPIARHRHARPLTCCRA